ncbi:MAG: glycosyltransferase family 2 protein [Actinomycetota bacterium]
MAILRLSALMTGVAYLGYRLVFTWSGANPVLYFLLVAAEAFGMLRLAMEMSVVGTPRPENRTPETGKAPDADVVVVVTDEPASEVRAAVLSSRLVRGYNKLVVVDRDDRPDVAELCGRLNLPRVAGTIEADLGELIDAALGQCESLLTLLVPADVVVMPDILEVTAGAFGDPEVGVVVSRIEATNAAHPVDFGGYGEDRIRDELMIDVLEPEGALPWWPGMAVVRRAAIENVGGMARGRQSVTLSTGVRLQADGWKVTDVPVIVARRLAPWTDDRHLHRWARDLHERIAVLVDAEAPRRNEYATRLSRRVYRLADIMVGRSIQRLVLVGVLFATMFTSSLPMIADPLVLLPLWGAWQLSSFALRRKAYGANRFVPWMSNDFRLLATNLTVAWWGLQGKPLKSELVDPAPGRKARLVLLIGLQIALGLSIAVFVTGVLRPAHGNFVTFATLMLAAWLWVMVLQARSALKLRQVRQNFRTFEELEVFASEGRLGVIGVSPFGLDVVSSKPLKKDAKLRLAFGLPQPDGSNVRLEVSTKVHRSARSGSHNVAYLRFSQLDDEQMDRITEYVAVMAGHRLLRDTPDALRRPGRPAPVAPPESEVAEPA